MQDNRQHSDNAEHRTSPAFIAFAWAAVLIPLAWGFVSTVIEAAALFQ